MGALPAITIRHLAGRPHTPLLVVGPSLGTSVDRLWGAVAQILPGWNIVGWDLPGHGQSPAVDRLTDGFTMAELADAVLDAIDHAVAGSPGFAYAGDSVGGAVGLQLALRAPARVTSLTLLCSAAVFGTPQGWRERAALVRSQGIGPMVEAAPARWFGQRIRSADDGRIPAILADLAAVDAEGYARVCDALATYDLRERLRFLLPPLLTIAGSDDVATPSAQLEEVSRAVPHGAHRVLDGVGHLAPYEDPAAVAEHLRAFVGESSHTRA